MLVSKYKSINEYIQNEPKNIQIILKKLRATVKKAAPKAVEKISYGMPTFYQNGNLVYFAAWKKHIGFYPAPSGIQAFKKELSKYKGSKGSIQFPFTEPLPLSLITKIVKARVKENIAKTKKKMK